MFRRSLLIAASVVLVIVAASAAKADTIQFYTNPDVYAGNDVVHWNNLGLNVSVPNGFTINSQGGVVVTGTFAGGGSGLTQVECPATSCTWSGNFAPAAVVLYTNSPGQGPLTLTFAKAIYGAGFQIQTQSSGAFGAELQAFDGSTVLATFFLGDGNSNMDENNSAIFLGLKDFTAADLTSIRITAFNCTSDCASFAINQLLLQTTKPTSGVPEPGTLMLLSSGLGLLGFLRRKLS